VPQGSLHLLLTENRVLADLRGLTGSIADGFRVEVCGIPGPLICGLEISRDRGHPPSGAGLTEAVGGSGGSGLCPRARFTFSLPRIVSRGIGDTCRLASIHLPSVLRLNDEASGSRLGRGVLCARAPPDPG